MLERNAPSAGAASLAPLFFDEFTYQANSGMIDLTFDPVDDEKFIMQ